MNSAEALEWLPSFLIPFFTLSYPTPPPAVPDSFPNSNYYNTGWLDGCLIITCIAVMAVLRDVTRIYLMEPFAQWKLTRDLMRKKRKYAAKANGHGKANGVTNGNGHAAHGDALSISKAEMRKMRRSVLRFAEQGWSVIYYTCQWCFGLYVHSNLPTAVLNPVAAWINYPHIPLAGTLKFYYLLQTAFYLHQILIINAEARRKDHLQMMTHHIITVVLMVGSYSYNYTRVGCLIMFLMDWCDIFLPLAKMLRYLSFSTLCDATFVWFLVSWLVTRHALFMIVIKSTWDARWMTPPIWDFDDAHDLTNVMWWGCFLMLVALQFIQLMWFWMICRVAWRVVSGQGAEDERSDDENDDNSDEKESRKER
ncbi:longevity assurance proteins LAG1/LAC1 [Obba rivulosa]|uniref:Longevity assurance proteins LAG1/LAC1 n=1 Tax=Obba rivulosa TaxID=1052685 RepID=A0A8E2B1H0_9APHY|nr:longevity assurance proteins LAG1/LAC1 [Obba rivulosa]